MPIEAIYTLFETKPAEVQSKMPLAFGLLQFHVPALRQYKQHWTAPITARFSNDLSSSIKESECLTLTTHLKQIRAVCQALLDKNTGNNFVARNQNSLKGLQAVSAVEMSESNVKSVDEVRLREIVELLNVVTPVKAIEMSKPAARL